MNSSLRFACRPNGLQTRSWLPELQRLKPKRGPFCFAHFNLLIQYSFDKSRDQAVGARRKKEEAQRLDEEKEAEAERRAEEGRKELALQREQELAGNGPSWGGGYEAKYGEGQAIAVPKGYFERLDDREQRRVEGEAWAKEQQGRREALAQQEKEERGKRQKKLVVLPAIADFDGPGLSGCDGAEQKALLLPHTLSFMKWTEVRLLGVLAHEWRLRVGSEDGW
jgi:hypothetical protein